MSAFPDTPFSLAGRCVAVIGAGSGIGEAVAVAAAAAGASVACIDLQLDAATRVASAITSRGGKAAPGACDVADRGQVEQSIDAAEAWGGRLDGVVSTPGINVRKPILAYTEEEFDRVLRVNVKGTFNVLQTAGRALCRRGHGSIVLFSSIRSQVVEPGQSAYAATKAAIVQLARAGAAEFARHGVRVNALAPGVVDTPLTAPIKAKPEWYGAYASKSALGRWAAAEEMAWPTVFLLSGDGRHLSPRWSPPCRRVGRRHRGA
jgi:NAD(P)-dependent dehydrogenase (short-subunit alcohol dehydrogenase family)